MDSKDLLSLVEAAKLVKRPVVTVRYWAQHEKIWGVKLGGSWVVLRQDVVAYARRRKAG